MMKMCQRAQNEMSKCYECWNDATLICDDDHIEFNITVNLYSLFASIK